MKWPLGFKGEQDRSYSRPVYSPGNCYMHSSLASRAATFSCKHARELHNLMWNFFSTELQKTLSDKVILKEFGIIIIIIIVTPYHT
jgi:hypothetical protein